MIPVRSIAFLELKFLHFARRIRMINIMENGIHTPGLRISVIKTDDIFGNCFNLLGIVALNQSLKIDC